jgi:phage repressor protein C with HTH and peptisase S24 domain
VKTFAELAEALVRSRSESQLRMLQSEDPKVVEQAFKTLLPLYTLKAAAGYFGSGEIVESEGWIEAEGVGRLDDQMFVCRIVGHSMEPRLFDGDYAVFRARPVGSREGRIVLAQYRGPADPETGGSYTVKKYSSRKVQDEDGGWRHEEITLLPQNPEFEPIVLTPESEEDFRVVAELVAVLGRA